ncbi:hypothetical protein K474DRAFT_1261511 [Panus rudis PR-1116 ss-1]|nr:hypothetical protein K474DRAFT_1261511 [Panus rudis PR-1116 ss-1]
MASYTQLIDLTAGGYKTQTSSTSSGNEVAAQGVPYLIQKKSAPPPTRKVNILNGFPSPIQRPTTSAAIMFGFNCNNSPTFVTFRNTPTPMTPIGFDCRWGHIGDGLYAYSPARLGSMRVPQCSGVEETGNGRSGGGPAVGLGINVPNSPTTTTSDTQSTSNTSNENANIDQISPSSPPLLPTRRSSPLRIETILDDDVLPRLHVFSYPSRFGLCKAMVTAPPASELPIPFVH